MAEALDRVISEITDTIQDSLMADVQRQNASEDAIFKSLFELELTNQQTYKQELIKAGLSLSDSEQSVGFETFANNAGDTEGLTNLASRYAILKQENELSQNMLTDYFAGQKFGGVARGEGYSMLDEIGQADSTQFGTLAGETFNPNELSSALSFGIDSGQISSKEGVSKAFKLGMQLDEQTALKNIEIKNKIFATTQDIKNQNLDRARSQHASLTSDIGTDVMINIGGALGQPIQALKSIFAITDAEVREKQGDNFDNIASAIRSNTAISNISQDLIAALGSYAGVDGDVSKFQEMASKAYNIAARNTGLENSYMEQTGATRLDAQEYLKSTSSEYKDNSILLTEYGTAGVIGNNELMTQAFLVEDLGGQIKESSITDAMNLVKGFSPIPDFDQISEEYNLIEGLDANLSEYNTVNNVYGSVFGSQTGLGLDNDLVKLAEEFADAEDVQQDAMNNFRAAGYDLQNLMTGKTGKGFVSFPAQTEYGLFGGYEPISSEASAGQDVRHGFFQSAHYALPSEDEIRNMKVQIEQGLSTMQSINYGTFGETTGRTGRNIDVQVMAKDIWDTYITAWEAAKNAKGQFVKIDDLIFGK